MRKGCYVMQLVIMFATGAVYMSCVQHSAVQYCYDKPNKVDKLPLPGVCILGQEFTAPCWNMVTVV